MTMQEIADKAGQKIESAFDLLRQECQGIGNKGPDYVSKQLHAIPPAKLVDRTGFILERCKGKVVLDIGASGYMHEAIVSVAKKCYGIDRPPNIDGWSDILPRIMSKDLWGIDLDDQPLKELTALREQIDEVELIICGEVLEHLSNPGRFLEALQEVFKVPGHNVSDILSCIPAAQTVFTVPNAFSAIARRRLEKDMLENVNIDHVAWYSPRTLKTLLERAGYEIKQWACYNGPWPFSEGIIVVCDGMANQCTNCDEKHPTQHYRCSLIRGHSGDHANLGGGVSKWKRE